MLASGLFIEYKEFRKREKEMKEKIKNNYGVVLIGIGIIIVYELLTDVFGILDTFLFVGLKTALPQFKGHIGDLLIGLVSSMKLLIPGFFLAVVLGLSIGVAVGLNRPLRKNVTPYINGFSAVPATLLTPYAIRLFPTFAASSIFIIFLGSFWPILGSTITAVSTIDKRYLENADTLEIKGMERLFKVVLPAASPTIFSGLQIALKFAFVMLVVAEMIGASSGLGYFVQYYSDFARFDLVMDGFLFLALVLVLIMHVLDKIKEKSLKWTINN